LLLHGLPGDDVNGSRGFDDRQPQPACARGNGVERRHGNPRQRLAGRRSFPGRLRRGGRRQLTGGFFGSRLRLLARRFDLDRRKRALILRDLRRRRSLRAAGASCEERNGCRCGEQETTQCGNTVASATAADDRQHATPQRRNRNPSPAILAVARATIRPGQQPRNGRTFTFTPGHPAQRVRA
jgi:hypothetical protein